MDSGEVEKIRNELDFVYRKAFRVVFIVESGLAAAATLIILFSIPHVPLDQPDDKSLKEEGKNADEERKGLGASP